MIDRTGQTWEYGGGVYLVIHSPTMSGVGEVREQLWYHPSVMLDTGEDTVYGEYEHRSWEQGEPIDGPSGVSVTLNRRRIT